MKTIQAGMENVKLELNISSNVFCIIFLKKIQEPKNERRKKEEARIQYPLLDYATHKPGT